MKILKIFFALLGAGALLSYTHKTIEYYEGTLISVTGAPGERSCAESGCHVTDRTSLAVQLLMPGSTTNYEAGKKYILTLALGDAVKSNVGYQVVALDESQTKSIGTLVTVQEHIGAIINGTEGFPDRDYLSQMPEDHYQQDAKGTYHFIWQAPFMDQGPVTFFVSGVAANMDGTNNGDVAFNTSITLNPSDKISDPGIEANSFSVYPTMVKTEINLNYAVMEKGNVVVTIYNMAGAAKEVILNEEKEAGAYSEKYQLGKEYENGIYLVQASIGGENTTEKIIITR